MTADAVGGELGLRDERALVAAALALGADRAGGPLAPEEQALALSAAGAVPDGAAVARLRDLILDGGDPLGTAFSTLRPAETRRESGATYTPAAIVRQMVDTAAAIRQPTRVVDPGVGSGRFLLRAGAAFPGAALVGIDIDPLATLMARATHAVAGFGARTRILLDDYRRFAEPAAGSTLYLGNPPYVRHHRIAAGWKDWLAAEAAALGLPASKLAGLHVHFFLATARTARPGDFGVFITAAEWLDVNYGALVRALLLGPLGGRSITLLEPTALAFPDAVTTAAVASFDIGAEPAALRFRRVAALDSPGEGGEERAVGREILSTSRRWSHLTRAAERPPEGHVELGELCRVHRGTVTGANAVWIAGAHSAGLPDCVLFPSITRAREVLEAGGLLSDGARLRRVIDLPADLDTLDGAERAAVTRFLTVAQAMGADRGYIARHRKAWWSVGLRAPAPIVATYMARRPPGFLINKAGVRHINIAHGLYPRDPLSDAAMQALVAHLHATATQHAGRTYAGGLTKFEPREMERLTVPGPALLAAGGSLTPPADPAARA